MIMRTAAPLTLSLPAHLGFLAVKLGSFRKELMGWTDKRVGLMSEIISGIQMIKFYAWEGACGRGDSLDPYYQVLRIGVCARKGPSPLASHPPPAPPTFSTPTAEPFKAEVMKYRNQEARILRACALWQVGRREGGLGGGQRRGAATRHAF